MPKKTHPMHIISVLHPIQIMKGYAFFTHTLCILWFGQVSIDFKRIKTNQKGNKYFILLLEAMHF
jgi:hypothetical protein